MYPTLRVSHPFLSNGNAPTHSLDALFDRFLGNDGDAHPGRRRDVGPLSVWQDENTIYVEADLPGVAENDVEITVHSGVLKIRAERRQEEGRTYFYNGRTFGTFERSVVLPETVDSNQVEATLTQGVLRVALPKHADNRPKTIKVKTQ